MKGFVKGVVLGLVLVPAGVAAQGVDLEGLMYLKYEQGSAGGTDFSDFAVGRSYFTAKASILPRLSARITMDSHLAASGDFAVRLKYAHLKYALGDAGSALTGMELEAGIAHTPWLGFEEEVNPYRMRDKMFLERNGVFNSADVGVTFRGLLGGKIGQDYQDNVSSHFPGRYGSVEFGMYNGGGYHAAEMNTNKVVEGRVTIRPLPDMLPGLQVSGFAAMGKGNQADVGSGIPDWHTYNAFVSYQHQRGTLTAQYVTGSGNQSGTWVEPLSTDATDYDGFSLFGEYRFGAWRVLGGFDDFNRTPGTTDLSLQRVHGGVAYALGSGNYLVLSADQVNWDDPARDNDTRIQTVFQVKF